MSYLICEKCGGYYELQPGESIGDFEGCSCGGQFKLIESLDDYYDTTSENICEAPPIKEDKINDSKPDTDKLTKNPPVGEKCPYCGAETNKEAIFCKICGYNFNSSLKLPDSPNQSQIKKSKFKNGKKKNNICSNCGEKNLEKAKFCAVCGNELKELKNKNSNKKDFLKRLKTRFSNLSHRQRLLVVVVGLVVLVSLIFAAYSLSSSPYATAYTSESQGDYMNSCVDNKISYSQLSKNPDKYHGERTYFKASTFQVMENGDKTNIIVGASSPEAYVFFDGTTPIVDNQLIYVFGEVYGSYSYTSQANYHISLPAITAKYIATVKGSTVKIYQPGITYTSDMEMSYSEFKKIVNR